MAKIRTILRRNYVLNSSGTWLSARAMTLLRNKRVQRAWATFWMFVFVVCFGLITGMFVWAAGRYIP